MVPVLIRLIVLTRRVMIILTGSFLATGGPDGQRQPQLAAVPGGGREGGDDAEHREGAAARGEPRGPHGQDHRPRGTCE